MFKKAGTRWVKSRGVGRVGSKKKMVEKEKVTLRCTSKKSGKPLEGEENTETKTQAKEVECICRIMYEVEERREKMIYPE